MKMVRTRAFSLRLSSPIQAGLLTAAALLSSASGALAQTAGTSPHAAPAFAGATHGAEAVAALGARLGELALSHDMAGEALSELLRRDPTLWVTDKDQLVYVDIAAGAEFQAQSPPDSYEGSIPLSAAFTLHTNPGADKVIFLDFDGHQSNNNGWGHNILFPPYNTSGSSATFTNGELQSIINHWEYIAEDFAPYNVDVTTEEPDQDHLRKTTFGDTKWGVRSIFTQITSGFGSGSGGIALLGTFTDFQDTPCFVFNKGDNTGSMSGSHEVGHTMGLLHDGLNGSSYHPGSGSGATSWGPIMGAPFGKTVVQWSNGDYSGSTATQDDTGIIGGFGNGFGLKSDDHGNSTVSATALSAPCPGTAFDPIDGVIGTRTDVDAFIFITSGGSATLSATPWNPGPNCDIRLELYNGAGVLIGSHDPSNATNATLSQTLAAGSYTVMVLGEDKPGSYSDYGSLGQYVLNVSAAPGSVFTDLGNGLAGSTGVPVATGSGIPCPGNTVSVDLSGALANTSAWLALGIGQLNAPFKGGLLVPNITAGGAFLPAATNGSGALSLPSTWPSGVISGVPLDFQFWIQDAGGVAGFAASNGLEMITP